MVAHGIDGLADEQPAFIRLDAHQRHPPVGEFDHLQRLGKFDELGNVIGDNFFRAKGKIDGEVFIRQQNLVTQEVAGAQAGDSRRQIEDGLGDLAGNEIGLIALGHGNQQIRVIGPGIAQDRWPGSISRHRAQVEAILQMRRRPASVSTMVMSFSSETRLSARLAPT